MRRRPCCLFRAFSALLSYPSREMRQALPEIADVVRAAPLLTPRERRGLLDLIDELGRGDLLRRRSAMSICSTAAARLSLHLFEHLHGDSRDRGEAMVDLKRLYERAGFELSARELPDYLPVRARISELPRSCRGAGHACGLRAYPDDDRPFADRASEAVTRPFCRPCSSSPARARSMPPRCRQSRRGPKRSTANGRSSLPSPGRPPTGRSADRPPV